MQHAIRAFRLNTAPLSLAVVLTGLLASSSALAQPAGLAKDKKVSGGSTEVAKEGFQAANKASAEESKDATSLKLMAGGTLITGNSQARAFTAVTDFQMRRADSQFSALLAVNLGDATSGDNEGFKRSVENYQAQARYDYFFNQSLAGFLNLSGRRDPLQGLALRFNIAPGLAYYAIDKKDLKTWVELGYALQHDIRDDSFIDKAAAADPPQLIAKTETRHNARLLIGYTHQLSEQVGFDTEVEYLQGLSETTKYRINWSAAITAQIAGRLSVATSVSMRYDHAPLPDVKDLDTVTAFNLVYTL